MVTPGNVNMIFSIIIPIAMFDVLDQDISIDNVIKFDNEAQEEAILKNEGSVFDQMADLGYDTHNAVLMLGSMGIFVLLYYFKLLINLAFMPIKNKKLQKLRAKMT